MQILSADDDGLERHTELYGWRFAGRYAVAAWSRVRDHYDPGFSGFTRFDLARGDAEEVQLGEPVEASLPPSATVAQLAVNHAGRVLALTNPVFTDPAGTLRLFDPQMRPRVLAHATGIDNLRLTSSQALWTEDGVAHSAPL